MKQNKITRPFFATTMKELQKNNIICIIVGFAGNMFLTLMYLISKQLSYTHLNLFILYLPMLCLFANIIIYSINFVKITKKEKIERKYKKFMTGFIPSVIAFVVCLVMWIIILGV